MPDNPARYPASGKKNHIRSNPIEDIKLFVQFRFKIIQPPKKPKIPELPREKNTKREDDAASMPPPPSPASSTWDGNL